MEFDSKPDFTFLLFGYLEHYGFSAENVKQGEPLCKCFLLRLSSFHLSCMTPSTVAHQSMTWTRMCDSDLNGNNYTISFYRDPVVKLQKLYPAAPAYVSKCTFDYQQASGTLLLLDRAPG